MRIVIVSVAIALAVAGCGDRPGPGGGGGASPGTEEGGFLTDIEPARPAPEELGEGWAYALGRKGPSSHGRTVNDAYENKKTGAYVKLVISKQQSVPGAVAFFESQIAGFQSPPHSGLGEDARVEPRGSRRRPYVIVCFRRRNVVVTLQQNGTEAEAALNVARIIDRRIKDNLER